QGVVGPTQVPQGARREEVGTGPRVVTAGPEARVLAAVAGVQGHPGRRVLERAGEVAQAEAREPHGMVRLEEEPLVALAPGQLQQLLAQFAGAVVLGALRVVEREAVGGVELLARRPQARRHLPRARERLSHLRRRVAVLGLYGPAEEHEGVQAQPLVA